MSVSDEDTIFDKIIRRELPSSIVYEDDVVLAFADIDPQAPVHVLVIPKKKVTGFAEFADADPADVGAFMTRVARVARELKLDAKGYRIVMNHGEDGGQTVSYVHAHILAGRSLQWPPG